MSANKRNETKIFEDETGDSGFLSGPLDSGLVSEEIEPEPQPVRRESRRSSDGRSSDGSRSSARDSGTKVKLEPREGDSGLVDIDDVTECLVDVSLSEPLASREFHCTVSPPEKSNLPPFDLFFQPDDDGDTQLHIAAIHGCVKSVGTLIKICPNKALLDIPNDDGLTALHLAVMNRHATVTRMLVLAGLSLAVRDRRGETPVHKASAAGDTECLQALLGEIEGSPRNLKPVLNQKNYNGQACVHLAASEGHLEALQTLYLHKADMNAKENLAGWTALHIAARRGDARVAQYLQRCAGVRARSRDRARRTPRRLARRTPAAAAFPPRDSDTSTDEEDDMYDSDDGESLFEALVSGPPLVNVA